LGSQTDDLTGRGKLLAAIKMVLSLAVLAASWWLGTRKGVYDTCIANVFLSYTLAGFALIYWRLCPRWADVGGVLAVGGLLTFIDCKILGYQFSVYGIVAMAGLAAISALALRSIWSAGMPRERFALAFSFAILTVSANALAGFFHNWTSQFTPRVLDLYLYCFDASLRVQFAFLMGQAYATWHWFRDLGMFVYMGFPLAIAVAFAGQLIRNRTALLSAMAAFLIAGPVGVIFYALFPALGPAYLFTSRYPWNPLTFDQASRLVLESLPLPGLRNSMPSLHVAWMLLTLWHSRGLSVWERAIAILFLTITVLATLGSGEHYFVDLVVAFPFALFIYGVCAFDVPWLSPERQLGLWVGLAMALGWVVVLRFDVKLFWISPAIPWLACIGTVVLALLLQRRVVRSGGRQIDTQPS